MKPLEQAMKSNRHNDLNNKYIKDLYYGDNKDMILIRS